MSAWIPAKEHIDAMVRILMDTKKYSPISEGIIEGYGQKLDPLEIKNIIGQAFTNEVVMSVGTRYPNDALLELPGVRPAWWLDKYEYDETTREPTWAEALKIFDCYDYQACEHESYETSSVRKLVEAVQDEIGKDVRDTDAYGNAPWGWTDEQALKEMPRVLRQIAQRKDWDEQEQA